MLEDNPDNSSCGFVIFEDEGTVHLSEEDYKNFCEQLSNKIGEKYYLKQFFPFPDDFKSMQIKDWQLVLYMKRKLFRKTSSRRRLAENENLIYFFLTKDKNFLYDAKEGFMEYSKRRKISKGVRFKKINESEYILLAQKVHSSYAGIVSFVSVRVLVLFASYKDSDSRDKKITKVFQSIEEHL